MGIDMKKLREMQKDIKKKAGQGDDIFLYANKLPAELNVRILPPTAQMNGIYFVEQEGWWINGKFYNVNGENDVIKAELDEARESGDKSLIALIDKKKDGMPLVKKEVRYLIPLLVLDAQYDDDTDELVSCKVEDTKVLVSKPTLLSEINKIVTNRQYQNGTPNGIADREKGFNIVIGKEGKGLDTEYTAIGWTAQMEMDEKYYDPKEIPDVYAMNQKAIKSEAHLVSVIRNYLYGDDIVNDETDSTEDSKETKKTTTAKSESKSGGFKRPSKGRGTKVSDGEEDAVEDKPKSKATTKRSLLDDVEADMMDMD